MGMVRRKLLVPEAKRLILPHARRFIPRPTPWIWVPRRIVPVRGAVAVDSTGTEQGFGTAGTTHTYTGLTVGTSLTNSCSVFGCFAAQSAGGLAGTMSATWNAVACTQAIQYDMGNGVGSLAIFFIVAPASGNKNFVLTTVNSTIATIQGTSFTGVNQSGGTSTVTHTNTFDSNPSNSASSTLTITTANGDYTVCITSQGGAATNTLTPGQLYDDTTTGAPVGATLLGAQNAETTTSRVYTSAQGSADFIVIVGADVVAASGAAVVEAGGFHTTYRVQRPTWR